jgi:putative ABC transport system substrate-binding protein
MMNNFFRLSLCALLFALCSSAAAQPRKLFRIGYLSNSDRASDSSRAEVFRRALRDLGYIDGQNILFEYRCTGGKLAAELVRLEVDASW